VSNKLDVVMSVTHSWKDSFHTQGCSAFTWWNATTFDLSPRILRIKPMSPHLTINSKYQDTTISFQSHFMGIFWTLTNFHGRWLTFSSGPSGSFYFLGHYKN